ncbi:MAG: hypothetical protein JW801_00985 [Bacteroidales bacterium]|nr:hypothetical protein [Bacteroidales bacterium]
MEQRDYLLRQIQMMAQVLTALIRKLTGLKEESSDEEQQMEKATNEMLTEHFDFELTEMMQVPVEEVAEWITCGKRLHIENLDLFAELLLLHAGTQSDTERKIRFLETAAALLSHVDEKGNTFSIERQAKILSIRNELAKYG